jgi:hypothetical protein
MQDPDNQDVLDDQNDEDRGERREGEGEETPGLAESAQKTGADSAEDAAKEGA